MGEVYKARDKRLNRTIAIKVLPPHFTDKPEMRARFDREAQTIATLNHPHICVLHDVGHQDGTDYLVMEFLEGQTLAQRLERGALPLQEALAISTQIADALDRAHRQGVVHRDLKPSNIMLTKSGAKLLDFGLAKLKQDIQPDSSLSAIPTQAPVTEAGMVLGTLQYMSPEQLEGRDADARADIFAFGNVVYEMVTGKKTFAGKSQAGLIAAILEHEPAMVSSFQPTSPLQLDHIINRCLAKSPDDRWQSASDLHRELKWIAENISQLSSSRVVAVEQPIARAKRRPLRLGAAAIGGLTIAILSGAAVWMWKPVATISKSSVLRLSVTMSSGELVESFQMPPLAFSPDGTRLVYSSSGPLYLREMNSFDSKPIPGTESASAPFFSPDGRWVGFFAGGKLKKISLTGGVPQTLCEASNGRGGSWAADDTIYFAPSNIAGIWKVSAAGGTPQEVTRLDRSHGEVTHRWPQILPDNKTLLFTARTGPGWNEAHAELVNVATGERRVAVQGAIMTVYASPGFLVYTQAGALMAAPFDLSRSALPKIPIASGVEVRELSEGSAFAVSQNGILGYLSGTRQFERKVVWVDRQGHQENLALPPRAYDNVAVSPDGRFAAVQFEGPTMSIWIYDFARTTLTPFTPAGSSQAPVWTPDGKRIVYRGTRAGFRNLFWKAVDGSAEEERLTTNEAIHTPSSISPDGKLVAFQSIDVVAGTANYLLQLNGDRKPQLLQASASNPQFSPDGHWIAYVSSESGRSEIYLRPFPGPGGKIQISTEGGEEPVWSHDGHELFYINSGSRMMAVDIRTLPSLAAGSPHLLFTGRYQPSPNTISAYSVSLDGKRFLKVQPAESTQSVPQINLVTNWLEELNQRAAAR
jgi:serine/threonine-protein kinase